jgi:hypothetical protein
MGGVQFALQRVYLGVQGGLLLQGSIELFLNGVIPRLSPRCSATRVRGRQCPAQLGVCWR